VKMHMAVPEKMWKQLHYDWTTAARHDFRITGAHIVHDLYHLYADVKTNASDGGCVRDRKEGSAPDSNSEEEIPDAHDPVDGSALGAPGAPGALGIQRTRRHRFVLNGAGRVGVTVNNFQYPLLPPVELAMTPTRTTTM